MTAPLPDDQVRAMLEERAGRVSPDAEREAMTAFRAAVRGAPDGKGGFTVIPQALSSRDARLPGGLAAFGVVVVVVIAVLGGRLSGNDVATSPSAFAGSGAITGPADRSHRRVPGARPFWIRVSSRQASPRATSRARSS